jgi:hypothetical protein
MLLPTHVILAEMDTLRSRCDRHIHAIIDNQRYIVTLGDGVQFLGCLNKDSSVIGFVSILDN